LKNKIKYFFFENFNISETNTISVELDMVLRYIGGGHCIWRLAQPLLHPLERGSPLSSPSGGKLGMLKQFAY